MERSTKQEPATRGSAKQEPATRGSTKQEPAKQGSTTRRTRVLSAAVLIAGLVAAPAASAASTDGHAAGSGQTVFEFRTMTPVVEPLTGGANPVRGIPGGGLPWQIDAAHVKMHADGELEVEVEGLVLARRAPVPEAQQGTNPIASLMAIVSCTTVSNGSVATVNVPTQAAPATLTGDATIEDTIELPAPCVAPIVFVTSPTGSWFAATGV